jgi:hypothetical protein
MDAQVLAAHHADELDRALVLMVEPQHQVGGEVAVGELLDGLQHHLQDIGIETGHGRPFSRSGMLLPSTYELPRRG